MLFTDDIKAIVDDTKEFYEMDEMVDDGHFDSIKECIDIRKTAQELANMVK